MKKRLVLILVLIFVINIVGCKQKTNALDNYENDVVIPLLLQEGMNKRQLPDQGIINNEETAIKVGEYLFKTYLAEHAMEERPTEAIYNKQKDLWLVKKKSKDKDGNVYMVGSPIAIIKGKDGQVLSLWFEQSK